MNQTVSCVECDAELNVPADAMENELISCPDCGVELEILSLNPLTIDLAPEVEEDWGE
ncbi:MAG: lysine biosynthesis protein LysW [Anaerolineae bacterium]|nr:lysine biosynthesis protein LysW [Anaerolineae bacterium]MCA9890711.1 lysine biosynthesis protein LysW [Anaerolineae bacterium]MCB9459341.1 lysine biosynthesis protein LysW [Anaerolineaceae bacterium]